MTLFLITIRQFAEWSPEDSRVANLLRCPRHRSQAKLRGACQRYGVL